MDLNGAVGRSLQTAHRREPLGTRAQAGKRWNRLDLAAAGSILALAVLVLAPLYRAGIAGSDDVLDTIYRVFTLDLSWQAGLFYPRLSADLAFNYGAPLFQYYPPAVSYVAELLHLAGLGFIAATKGVYLLALAGGGLGMYVYGHRLFGSRSAALLAAVAYLAAPYQLANVFVRGAAAEATGLALLPWVLWAFHSYQDSGGRRDWLTAALLLAGLLVTHNGVSLFFLPVLCVYLAALAVRSGSRRRAALGATAICLALGLSAFFWLPALAERGYANIGALAQDFYDPARNLTRLADLVQGIFLFDYARPQVFRLGLITAAVAAASLAVVPLQKRGLRLIGVFYLALLAFVLLLQLPVSGPFWQNVGLARFIQFPWRLLGFAALSAAVLLGSLVEPCVGFIRGRAPALEAGRARLAPVLAALAGALWLAAALPGAWQAYALAGAEGSFQEAGIGRQDMNQRGLLGFELFSDYYPATAGVPMQELPTGCASPGSAPAISLAAAPPQVQVQRAGPLDATVRVDSAVAFPLSLHRFYFPGWQATIDNAPVPVYPSGRLGLVAVNVPPGVHEVGMRFGPTPLRQAAIGLAVVSGLLWLLLAVGNMRGRRLLLALAVVLIAGTGAWLLWPRSTTEWNERQVNVGQQTRLAGFSSDRSAYAPGETARVTLYWLGLGSEEAYTGSGLDAQKVFVHLRDAADQAAVSQHDGLPAGGFTPVACIVAGELVADEHELVLPGDLPPGTYSLVAGMYDATSMQNLAVAASRWTLPGERVLLTSVRVGR